MRERMQSTFYKWFSAIFILALCLLVGYTMPGVVSIIHSSSAGTRVISMAGYVVYGVAIILSARVKNPVVSGIFKALTYLMDAFVVMTIVLSLSPEYNIPKHNFLDQIFPYLSFVLLGFSCMFFIASAPEANEDRRLVIVRAVVVLWSIALLPVILYLVIVIAPHGGMHPAGISQLMILVAFTVMILVMSVIMTRSYVVSGGAGKAGGASAKRSARAAKKPRGDVVAPGNYNVRTMTKAQKNIYRSYFMGGGCLFSKKMSDKQYMAAVEAELKKRNIRSRALERLGLAEEQIAEIGSAEFRDFYYTDGVLIRNGNSSKVSDSILFFGNDQLYVYKYVFDMCNGSETERMGEYFYKDITNVTAKDSVKEFTAFASLGCMRSTKEKKGFLRTTSFTVVVPDETFTCSMHTSEELQRAIFAMKQKIREKKA